MLIHELTMTACADVLQRSELGHLACVKDNQPYVVPVHFSFDRERGCIYSFSTVGQKVRWMRANPQVCLAVEEVTDKDHWHSVVVFGRYEEMQDSAEDKDARERAQALFQQKPEWWLPAAARLRSHEPHAVVVYRILIERMTGRRANRNLRPVAIR